MKAIENDLRQLFIKEYTCMYKVLGFLPLLDGETTGVSNFQ